MPNSRTTANLEFRPLPSPPEDAAAQRAILDRQTRFHTTVGCLPVIQHYEEFFMIRSPIVHVAELE